MNIINKILLCIFISILTFINCEHKAIEYWNLKVGNSWVLQNLKSLDDPPGMLEYKCVEKYNWEGKTVYKLTVAEDNYSSPDEWFLIYTDGELRCYFDEEPSNTSDYYIFLKEPIETGKEWDYERPIRDTRTFRAKILSTNLTLLVPAGKLNNCVKVEYYDIYDKSYYYYAPKIGMVKFVGEYENYELVDYNIKER